MDKGLKEIIHFRDTQGQGYLEILLFSTEKPLELYFPDVETKAYERVGEVEILVFGNTHKPLVSIVHKVVNSGSWVGDADTNNTLVEIEGDQISSANLKINKPL
jgi:predicted phosphodiesterase